MTNFNLGKYVHILGVNTHKERERARQTDRQTNKTKRESKEEKEPNKRVFPGIQERFTTLLHTVGIMCQSKQRCQTTLQDYLHSKASFKYYNK